MVERPCGYRCQCPMKAKSNLKAHISTSFQSQLTIDIIYFMKLHMSRLTTLSAIAVLSITLSACGGSSKSASATTPKSTTTTVSLSAYRNCLSQHGITLPSIPRGASSGGFGRGFGSRGYGRGGGFGASSAPGASSSSSSVPRFLPAGVTAQQFAAARKACANLRPTGLGAKIISRFVSPAQAKQMFANYSTCMGKNGYPVPSTLNQALQTVTQQDRHSSAFINANNACKSILRPTASIKSGLPGTTSTTS